MDSSDEAYCAAKVKIQQAKEAGNRSLVLFGSIFHNLSELPPEILGLTQLTQIAVSKCRISDEDLRKVGRLKNLTSLQLLSENITDVGVRHLAGLSHLATLNLSNSSISDESISTISGFNNLTNLDLDRTPIHGAYFDSLSRLPKLMSLSLNETRVSDDVIEKLRGISSLRAIQLRYTNLTDRASSFLFPHRDFVTIVLDGTRITDETLSFIGSHQELQILSLRNTGVTDRGLSFINDLPKLFSISLSGTGVTDAGLDHLSTLHGLQGVDLNGIKVSDSGILKLKDLMLLSNLHLAGTEITDEGLSIISSIKNIRSLDFSGTRITEEGLSTLSKLEELSVLNLDRTKISDLRPLLKIHKLEEGVVRFSKIPALDLDQKLVELSTISDDGLRTKETYSYLRSLNKSWPPIPEAPKQDDFLRVELSKEGRFDVRPALPNEVELHDSVKQKSHRLLLLKAKELAQTGGNRFPWIARSASALVGLLERPLHDVDIVAVHLELESLRGSFERRNEGEEDDRLSQEVVSALSSVLIIGPGLVLDNDDVQKLEERRHRNPVSENDIQALRNILHAIEDNPKLFADGIRDYSRNLGSDFGSSSAISRVAQQTLARNTVIAIGIHVADRLMGGPLGEIGNQALAWLVRYSGEVAVAMPGLGEAVRVWLTPILMRVREVELGLRFSLSR